MQQYPELKRNINNRDFYEPAVEEEGARRGRIYIHKHIYTLKLHDMRMFY